ncbi:MULTISPECIES: TonB C-terminal domain-containing protein [unclassified Campylobacter]|uniref:TonB C-terminal domain-containing protein n=1 Tax=unclassified Campylobacter TaxID=2593542 RepID=UPI001474006E|nr:MULTISPECIES: TonB C-terminal domain-containing protein [unclassified Campylobacter]QKG28638.1 Tol-Pal system subunit TolA [Campylobacter sp. RM16187]
MDKILEPKFNTFSYFILSFILYISIVSGIFIKLTYFRSEEPKKYTDTKDAFMDIMIVEREQDIVVKAPEKKEEVVKVEEPEKKIEEVKEELKLDTTNKPLEPEVKPEPEIVQKTEEPSLKDLFKDINISKLKDDKVVKKTESLKEQSRKKPEKNQSQNSQKKASDVINALKLDKVAKAPKTQMTGEYHPYFGQIERILQAKWSAYKADSNDNAEVEISIDLSGNFSYDIKKLSYNSEFNDKVREFLQSMTFEKFPPSELGRTVTLKTTLVDKIE